MASPATVWEWNRRNAWALPAALAAAVTAYISWGAWASAHHSPQWLQLSHAWWRAWLRPDDNLVVLVVVLLWLAALVCYWWPRRRHPQTIGLTVVVAMAMIGGILGAASLARCRSGQGVTSVVFWVLELYVGQPPAYQVRECPGPPSLALQLASVICLSATLVGALTAGAVLWREPLGRLRARLVRDAIVVTGLDSMTVPLLRRLAATGRPASIVVIEPDPGHPLLDEARATGAKIMIADPASQRVLLPVLAGWRGCALRYLYSLRQDVAENEAVLAAACAILRRYRPDPDRQPHLVARIDDPRHAEYWRGWHSGTSPLWFEDALSPQESTAAALVGRILHTETRQIVLCGDSTLALAILLELARRGWERQGLAQAAVTGRMMQPDIASPAAEAGPAVKLQLVDRVVLLDPRAEDLRREYLAMSPRPLVSALPVVAARAAAWGEHLLAILDGMAAPEAAQTTVVVADELTDNTVHEAGRVARLHPAIPLFVLSPTGSGSSGPIFDLLQPFQRALLVDGQVPEDTWTRMARHWHECYRLMHPAVPGHEPAPGRRPWAELDHFIRQDNILQLRSVMTAVVARGRRWVPVRAVPAGSFIELSDRELEEVAHAEHTRWFRRRWAAGWRSPAAQRGAGRGLLNSNVVPWAALPGDQRAGLVDYVRSQLAQLEDVGFVPVVPGGGPPEAADFRRVGAVRAKRLHARRPWTRRAGDQLCGDAGDWRVVDDTGDERTVRDREFRASHELLSGDRWSRTGVFRAWQVREPTVLRTMEGRAVAQPGDWVVEGSGGERWPVTPEQFQRTYQATITAPAAG